MFSFHSTAAVEQAFYTIKISEFTLVVSFLFPFHSLLHSLLILNSPLTLCSLLETGTIYVNLSHDHVVYTCFVACH